MKQQILYGETFMLKVQTNININFHYKSYLQIINNENIKDIEHVTFLRYKQKQNITGHISVDWRHTVISQFY